MNTNQEKVEEAGRKGEALALEVLAETDELILKTASLRHQVNKLKDELAEEIALAEQKKPSAQ